MPDDLRRRPQGGEDDVLEGAVLLHRRLELVEGHLAVAVGVHLVEHLVQLPRLRDVPPAGSPLAAPGVGSSNTRVSSALFF